jgi:cytochrome b involved in lipid metabolism
MTTLLTYAEVAAHSSKKDLYVVIHDSVYNASSFVDEHPCVPTLHPIRGNEN